jgi:GMP synthase-like glutamine amidotransferase
VRAVVVGNRGDADPGLVGARLAELGFVFDRNDREYPREWKPLAGVDLVLLLGSEWSVYWESNQKEVAAECDLVRTATSRGVPIFAICFGAQLVAHTFGGNVSRSTKPEVGWHMVSSTAHPELLSGEWLQWHYDVFTVPQGFSAVATNDVGPQAMVSGRIFATQFHPEATTEIVTRWSSGVGTAELHKLGIDPKKLVDESHERVAQTAPATARLVDWFLATVSSGL